MMVIMERTKVSLSVVGVLFVCATSLASEDPIAISDRCVTEETVMGTNCAGPRCDMRVTIDYLEDTDSYDVTINTPIEIDKWTGIGFSSNGAMIGSDAILVWINGEDGRVQVKDYQLNDKSTSTVVEDNNSDGLTFQEMNYQGGILNVRFNRLRNTGDRNDFVLTDEDSGCAMLLLPKPGDGFGSVVNGVVQYHRNTPMVTSSTCVRPCRLTTTIHAVSETNNPTQRTRELATSDIYSTFSSGTSSQSENCTCIQKPESSSPNIMSKGAQIGLIVVAVALLLYAVAITVLLVQLRRKVQTRTEENGPDPYMDLKPRTEADRTYQEIANTSMASSKNTGEIRLPSSNLMYENQNVAQFANRIIKKGADYESVVDPN